MAKKLMKNYPLGVAKPMPTKVIHRRVTTHNHPGVVTGHRHTFNVRHTGNYSDEAYRPNSMHNDRPREPH